jgi:two-component system sensor histidine kinase AgrC
MVENFIVTFTEVISIMILWSKFGLEKTSLLKNLLIIVITTLVNTVTQFNLYANTILSYLAFILSVCYIYHRSIARAILEFLFVALTLMVLQIIVISLFGIFVAIDMNNFNISLRINMLIIFLCFIIYQYVPVFNRKLVIKIDKKIITYFITNFFGYILVTKVLWDYDNDIILKNWISFVLIISAMFVINTIMYFYIVKVEQERRDTAVKAKYGEVLRGITDEVRGRQHDFKNHLNVISGLVELNDKNKDSYMVKNYINSLSTSMQSLENIIYIDNYILSAILYSKLHEANKINVKFIYDIKNSLIETSLKDYELVEVLTNLIDNGFDALEKYQGGKCLTVKTYFEENMNILEVGNSGINIKPEDINKIFQRGFTTKEKAERGLGLYNVKKIVEHNGGRVQLSFEENSTIFKLFIL